MQAIGAVIFDMDGVLVDSEPLYMEQEKRSCLRYGVTLNEKDLSRFLGTTQHYMWSTIKNEYALTESIDHLMAQHQQQLMRSISFESFQSMLGVEALLNLLEHTRVPCAVASSSPRNLVELILKKTKLRRFFKEVICGTDVKESKPNPEIFLTAAKGLGVSPRSCLVIEDSHHGVTAAKAAHMFCIGLRHPSSLQQDLSAADLIANNHCDIKQWFAEK
ncbi:HAD family hydrolase [Pseudomonas coronafaciens]|uniref:HAD family hydrolase n=1 Tax=Pseudomonas coronafaciens TaxID=53409 RepID=UPI0006D5DC7D|nr:HAD family phosphatase [Pseudomonas coronafaciens]KPY27607.1 Uncharacterized protein ALO89_03017 [Pseudomonas coronafaciens pv. porri]RMW01340.1 hypothetical protein ALO99_200176 [Pseudomonas coronafaciens pv. porri]RMW01981.1 hypothetical protein ALP00_02279 [Pseudomonas coronafaciens pv. porri]